MARKKKVAAKALTAFKIECTLRKMREYETVLPDWNPNKKRRGRYSGSHGSSMPKNRYSVLANVDGDFKKYFAEGMLPEDVALGCINFLNTPPPRKKYAKRTPKPLYGTLGLVRQYLKTSEDGDLYFQLVLSTDQKKNKHFWGAGS